VPRECSVVDIAARDEIIHDLGGDLSRRATAAQPRSEIGPCPRVP
jgi:hypothetical protein